MPRFYPEYTGSRHGRLLVIGRATDVVSRQRIWCCVCDCGGSIAVESSSLRSGRTRSCGCLARESKRANGLAKRRHGLTYTPTWRTWQSMISRCANPNVPGFKDYGGRGITVCQRWQDSLESFLADMGPRPAGTTIERVHNDQGYEPGNCVWADLLAQANNKRNNRRLTVDGRTQTISQWAREMGVNPRLVCARLTAGWPVERAVLEPVHQRCAP